MRGATRRNHFFWSTFLVHFFLKFMVSVKPDIYHLINTIFIGFDVFSNYNGFKKKSFILLHLNVLLCTNIYISTFCHFRTPIPHFHPLCLPAIINQQFFFFYFDYCHYCQPFLHLLFLPVLPILSTRVLIGTNFVACQTLLFL